MADRGKPLSLDEFFEEQRKVKFIGAVEIAEDASFVKITPYLSHRLCQCQASFNIARSSIEEVTPTGDVKVCCGKRLSIVEITFLQGATMPVADVVAHITQAAKVPHGNRGDNDGAASYYPWSNSSDSTQVPNSRPGVTCDFGYRLCRGRCGDNCYSASIGETCRDGQVCPFGLRQCGCDCYDPAIGETCQYGRVVSRKISGRSVQKHRPSSMQCPAKRPEDLRAGCYACSSEYPCYRQCWDEDGQWYWGYDPACC